MKISKRTREQAALICAIAASGGVWDEIVNFKHWSRVYIAIREAAELGSDALRLAVRAYSRAMRRYGSWTCEVDAEAEALLRCGWSP